jgi:hypothetical protein
MLTGIAPEREPAVTPSQESEGVTAACSVRLCYQAIALRDRQALTAFWTSSASRS